MRVSDHTAPTWTCYFRRGKAFIWPSFDFDHLKLLSLAVCEARRRQRRTYLPHIPLFLSPGKPENAQAAITDLSKSSLSKQRLYLGSFTMNSVARDTHLRVGTSNVVGASSFFFRLSSLS